MDDRAEVEKLTHRQAKAELLSALTIIRKVVGDVPDKKKKIASSYDQKGHIRCVNYLRGFLNIWEKRHGS